MNRNFTSGSTPVLCPNPELYFRFVPVLGPLERVFCFNMARWFAGVFLSGGFPVIYRLSNAQKKQLLIRAVPLTIALPTPPTYPDDWTDWACRVLVEDGQYVSAVSLDTLAVGPSSDGGMNGIIGEIKHEDDGGGLTWGVDVALVYLDPPTPARHQRSKPQWPAMAEHNGVQWPKQSGQKSAKEPAGAK